MIWFEFAWLGLCLLVLIDFVRFGIRWRRARKAKAVTPSMWARLVVTVALGMLVMPGSELNVKQRIRDWIHPRSRFEKLADMMLDTDPAIRGALQGKPSVEAKEIVADATRRGLPRLPFPELVEWNDFRIAMANFSEASAASMWRGAAADASVRAALESITDPQFDRWTKIIRHAIVLGSALDQDPPGTRAEMPKVIQTVKDQLDEPMKLRFDNLLATGPGSDADAAWMMRTILGILKTAELDDRTREELLRCIASR